MRTRSKHIILWTAILTIALILTACNYPGLEPTPDAFGTAAAQTVAARLTESASDQPATDAPPPAATDTPEEVEDPTDTPEPATATPEDEEPCDQALFITDVTIPDGTVIAPGASFTKTWRLRNTGTCTWTSGYALIFQSGDVMGGPTSTQITSGTVGPGQTVDVSVDLTAPSSPGEYQGNWRLRNSSGVSFGITNSSDGTFFVLIEVADPTNTPYPIVASGQLTVRQTYSVDLDTGGNDTPPSSARDIWFEAVAADEKYLTPRNGARIALWPSGVPSLSDCASASLSEFRISMDLVSPGSWVCYETNLGNIGRVEIEDITGDPQVLSIDFKTWDYP